MMKMAAVCEIVLLLLWGSVTSAGSNKCDIYATTGMNVTVHLGRQVTEEKVRWKCDDTVILDRKGTKFTKGTENDVYKNGSLKLTKVQKTQSGEYIPEVFTEHGTSVKGLSSTYLCVLDPVPKPKVTQKCSSSKTEVEFTCAVGRSTDSYTFKWLQGGKEVEKKITRTLKVKTQQVKTMPINCIVANEASQMTSDPVKQECVQPGFVFPKEVWGISVWVFVAGGGGIVIVLILITIVCCFRAKRKNSMRLKDEEELRLGWTSPQQEQHQHQHNHPPDHPHRPHHHHHHQQQPAGHTGPRQQRTKQPRPRAPDPTNGQPQPNPRRAQLPKPPNDDDDQPPPLPQPRKKGPKTPKM